ncbi:hypothetical protein A0H81_04713 [Grifola frondosa]|uniref:Uncharacterized protein n=1 Tax=Grifola frondosa TaxID=5627 RepID=A0A1C7MFF6_GRIFR|nr:hypothetical protein A0H81_04713 [Grifola frondosa]
MSSTNFTPSNIVDMTKERDWPANLGMLDWDNTSIVFTKRSLLEFLKYAGVTVDPNFINIQKLPRYAQFGKLDGSPSSPQNPQHSTPSDSAPTAPVVSSFRPTRRVREAPGGTHTNLFSNADDDAAASAPPPIPTASAVEEVNPPSATKEVLETTTDNTITQAKFVAMLQSRSIVAHNVLDHSQGSSQLAASEKCQEDETVYRACSD